MYMSILGFPSGSVVKNPPAMHELQVRSLAQATYSSILAWRIPRTEEPGRLQSIASQSRTWLMWLSTHACMITKRASTYRFLFPSFSASLSSLGILQSLFEIYYKNVRVLWLLFLFIHANLPSWHIFKCFFSLIPIKFYIVSLWY